MTKKDHQAIFAVAEELFQQRPDWIIFFREIFGIQGALLTQLKTPKERREFEVTDEYARIQQMLTELKEAAVDQSQKKEPIKVLPIRVSKQLHLALKQESHDFWTSVNKLVIEKLKRTVNPELMKGAVAPEKTITARLPESLHEHLQVEITELDAKSINQLAVAKLRQPIDPSVFQKGG